MILELEIEIAEARPSLRGQKGVQTVRILWHRGEYALMPTIPFSQYRSVLVNFAVSAMMETGS